MSTTTFAPHQSAGYASKQQQQVTKINLNLDNSNNGSQHSQQALTSNPMIVNSQPYNPSHQQRCIGLNQQQQQQQEPIGRIGPGLSSSTGNSQQNSLYGSAFASNSSNNMQSSHMFDLANLQQSVFDSAYDIAANVVNEQQQQQPAVRATSRMQRTNGDNQQLQQNEVSLYSPSSSTSLLYHIYDQINVPSEQQQQQQANLLVGGHKKSSTILNPANLFGSGANNSSQPVPLPMQLHQHQVSELQRQQQQQQQCYSASHHQHLQPFSTLHQHQSSYMSALQQSNLMLDTALRQQQQHHTTTAGRHHHQRPLSSSGTSSMSGQSMAPIAYGRQPRSIVASAGAATLGAGIGSAKSQANLASVFQATNTLSHLGIGHSAASPSRPGQCAKGLLQGRWKRFQQRARHYAYEYRTIVKFSLLLILLALSLMSIIKFTLLNASNSAASQQQQQQQATSSQLGSNTLLYPPFLQKLEPNFVGTQPVQLGSPIEETTGDNTETLQQAAATRQPQQQDVLKSKLLIGEFVILSQNYTHSQSQKSLLAERIVKLMDQVFLATDVRRVYSRMEVTNIRPNRPNGIVVDCNIILSDSIAYAAQQFGIALYDSLARSHERLANQANYIIDKNSIRFNTVPDKDLKSGIVPPGLISPSLSRELAVGGLDEPVAPSSGQSFDQSIEPPVSSMQVPVGPSNSNLEQADLVVWSEWSEWSSCVDKNGVCDPSRHHSRIRKCLAQLTGKEVNATLCKERFNMEDQRLEMAFCTRTCQQQQQQLPPDAHIMSDAPSIVGPQTAPSVLIGGEPSSFMLLSGGGPIAASTAASVGKVAKMSAVSAASSGKELLGSSSGVDVYSASSSSASPVVVSATTPTANSLAASSTTERVQAADMPTLNPLGESQQQLMGSQMSCSNCTSDEICLLLMQEKVPFCAKIKERSDESGCGGWCKAQNQLCQPVGQNAFKCIHDSECLAEEWRCHDSACIPLSKRCDGHSNCYDSSDERDCPAIQ